MTQLACRNLVLLFILLAMTLEMAAWAGSGDYYDARRLFWSQLYSQGGETLYCGRRFESAQRRGLNIEHVMPMAWVMNEYRCQTRQGCRQRHPQFNVIESDLHNLYPSLRDVNAMRASYPFGLIKGERSRYRQCDFEIDYRRRVVEPRREVRGDIARAMFYMHDTYGIRLHSRLGKLLQRWNREDPPTSQERLRNVRIEKLQGKRNHFIDNPAAANTLRF